jgi:DNA-binding NarL/FixJ family response regulator
VRTALGEVAFAAAWSAGRTLSLDAVLAEAIAAPPESAMTDARSGAAPCGGLTPRELDVLRFLVEGRTDKEIAAALFVSPSTVTTHVRSILGKLEVTSRAAAAAAAVRRGLA